MILFKLLITSWLHHQKETATPKQKKPYNTNKQHQTEKQHQQQTTQKKNASFFSAKLFVFYLTFPRMVGSALSNGSGHLPVVSVKVQRHCPGDVRRSRRSGSRRKRLRLRWHRRKRRGPGGGGGRMLWGIFWGGFFFVFVFGWVERFSSYMFFLKSSSYTKKLERF